MLLWRWRRAGPFHSQSIESWFTCVPVLKVVAPATVNDAKILLLSAFQDPNPVLFLEHKKLYRGIQGLTHDGYESEPLGRAIIRRTGHDLTICTYGWGVHHALDKARAWETHGASSKWLICGLCIHGIAIRSSTLSDGPAKS